MRDLYSVPPIRVTIWNENVHETTEPEIQKIYPKGIHGAIQDGLALALHDSAVIRTVTLSDPYQGLPEEVLQATDVLIWWSHIRQEEVDDSLVDRIQDRVLRGMGFIALHSATKSKIFRRLMGTTCCLRWRHGTDSEYVWTVKPDHPIARGVPEVFKIDQNEMFGEFFDIPDPDELVFISSFEGREVLRSGLCYRRGYGRVFYFSPGDQSYPVYFNSDVRQVIANAVQWAAPHEVHSSEYLSRQSPEGWLDNATKSKKWD